MLNKKLIALGLSLLMLLPAFAMAEEELEGSVVAGDTITVTAPYGGTIQSISLREGALINAGDAGGNHTDNQGTGAGGWHRTRDICPRR